MGHPVVSLYVVFKVWSKYFDYLQSSFAVGTKVVNMT